MRTASQMADGGDCASSGVVDVQAVDELSAGGPRVNPAAGGDAGAGDVWTGELARRR